MKPNSLDFFISNVATLTSQTEAVTSYATLVFQGREIVPHIRALALYSFSDDFFSLVSADRPDFFPREIAKGSGLVTFLKVKKMQIFQIPAKMLPKNMHIPEKQFSFVVPLWYQERLHGIYLLTTTHPDFASDEKLAFLLHAHITSLVIENIRLVAKATKDTALRDSFISMTVHELRTPLTTLLGYIQLLDRKLPQEMKVEKEWLAHLKIESNRLHELINEFLDIYYARVGKLHFDFAAYPIAELLQAATRNITKKYPQASVKFEVLGNIQNNTVIADKYKLLQVLTILLDNAVVFSEMGSPISITLKKNGHFFIIRISDQGKGIAKADLPHVFDEAYTSLNHKNQGVGSSLFLAKKIVEEHRGSITVQSKITQGTKVTLELPGLG